ncbi:signal peptidase I [Streptomyces sp. NPDC059506]|uniref:signal peptidase I n=1 Tax=Streptomyces TaxID=1883 RepID=UPI000CC167F0|nr:MULTISPECIES: signal peptidase I [unclassified Streptomyces]MCZ2524390.1 signal peptidase I [Streptomyces sp. HB2AG]PLW71222.1 signal peptidase I [Streptomyces sp. DJ]QMV21577.1 signal peptidase I [Streptomyces sp. SCUT-3]
MGDLVVGARSGPGEPEEAANGADRAGERPGAAGGRDGRDSGPEGSGEHEEKQRSFWKELPILIGIALILALLIKTFLVQAFSIPSDSMQNTLQRGDRVLVDKLTPWFGSEPERGEVVVFHDPGGWLTAAPEPEGNAVSTAFRNVLGFVGLMPSSEDQDLIKRVIAIGGDTVECSGTGPVRVNGKALDEKAYVFPGNTPCGDKPFGPVKIPADRIWVMGDHRQDSMDSRYHQDLPGGGTVPVDEVVGRAVVIAWPVDRWTTLSVPDTFEANGLAAPLVGAAPAALGLAGAVPLVLWRRRKDRVKAREEDGPRG